MHALYYIENWTLVRVYTTPARRNSMPVVLCPCSLSSALVEDLHLTLSLNAIIFIALLALLWKADFRAARDLSAAHAASAHAVYYPLLQ